MLRKRLAAAAAAALLTLGLAACGGGDGDDAEQATGPVKLRFLSLAWQKDSVAANHEIVFGKERLAAGARVRRLGVSRLTDERERDEERDELSHVGRSSSDCRACPTHDVYRTVRCLELTCGIHPALSISQPH